VGTRESSWTIVGPRRGQARLGARRLAAGARPEDEHRVEVEREGYETLLGKHTFRDLTVAQVRVAERGGPEERGLGGHNGGASPLRRS